MEEGSPARTQTTRPSCLSSARARGGCISRLGPGGPLRERVRRDQLVSIWHADSMARSGHTLWDEV